MSGPLSGEDKIGDMVGTDRPATYVTLDLEMTGLNPDLDAIIEIGAVKFEGYRVLETFQTLVNPYREIPAFIHRLTGIEQRSVDRAPPLAAVAGQLLEFVGNLPVVGHNVAFDLGFLSRSGVELRGDAYDTWDLASVLLPYAASYSLPILAPGLGVEHSEAHRALNDAQATHKVFMALMGLADRLDPAVLSYIGPMAARARWPTGLLLGAVSPVGDGQVSRLGVVGIDLESLGQRIRSPHRAPKPRSEIPAVGPEEVASYLAPGGLMARAFPGFEHRPQQIEMARAVAEAIDNSAHLVVEAGTGVGKSLAYLLPAAIHSLRNGARVVVSTNTINLQEQLIQNDIPALVGALEEEGIVPRGELRAVPLKGKANYLCLRRWNHVAGGDGLSVDEARVLSKTLVWLQDTGTGDRGEINLAGRDAVTWGRISAAEKGQCPGMRGEGVCFVRAARDGADGAHIIVVNHALLLTDMAMGGGLLPEYRHLIIDEAHHLEEAATQQLGFQVSQERLGEELDALGRLISSVRVLMRGPSVSGPQGSRAGELVEELESRWSIRARADWDRLWNVIDGFFTAHQERDRDQFQMGITRSTRAEPGWSEVEIAWENVDLGLGDGTTQMERLRRFLETLSLESQEHLDALMMEVSTWQGEIEELQRNLKVLLAAPAEETRIDWMARVQDRRGDSSGGSSIVLHSAPLNVGPELQERLFSKKDTVVLTSATLSTEGNFDYIRDRVGLYEGEELLVGSPFDYRRAALLLIPSDMPLPDTWEYQQAMEGVLVELARALDGHTLVLFTSHSALRGAAKAIRGPLEAEGIQVLAQGVDGSPRRILQSFAENPKGVILGTSSFWEGVDLSGGVLKALVLARIPFHVPTEPVFAARSAQFDNPFQQYALPQAVLRFRQGIGRLIRSSRDRGAIVVLDRRITARAYGKAFLDSIPPCTLKSGPLSAVPGSAAEWVGKGR